MVVHSRNHTVEQLWRDRSQFQASPMPVCRYVEESSVVAMLAAKRSAGVTPEMNLRKHIIHMPLPNMNKAAHSGFETQRRRYQKSKTGVSVVPKVLQKRTISQLYTCLFLHGGPTVVKPAS